MLKKNVPAFSTEQNASVVIQSVHSKVGMLAARFAQTDQWSDIGVGCHENENEDENENENEDLSFVFVRKRTTRSSFSYYENKDPALAKRTAYL